MSHLKEAETFDKKGPEFTYLRFYSTQPEHVVAHFVKKKSKTLKDVIVQSNLMHPFIQYMICTLRNSAKPAILKNEQCILSFCQLIPMLGPEAFNPALRSSIVHLLRYLMTLATDDPRECEIIIQAHDAFIRSLDLTKLDHENLIILAIHLKLLLIRNEDTVVRVFDYLIVQNASKLASKLLDLHFVKCSLPSFSKINDAIERAAQEYGHHDDPISRILLYSNMSIRIDEDLIKYFTLSVMHMRLVENIGKAFQDGRIEPWACKVINNLLITAKTADEMSQIEVAKCLGLFGAIDSVRFAELPGSEEVKKTEVYLGDITTADFKEHLIRDIALKALALSGSSAQVTYKCSLKGIYNALGMKPKDRTYIRLSPDVKSIIEAALASPYQVQPVDLRGEGPKTFPLFKINTPYSNWIRTWVVQMISDFKEGTPLGDLFIALRPVFVQDSSFLEEMLPCLIFNYLRCDYITDERKRLLILGEINAVISSALPPDNLLGSFEFSSAIDTHVSVTALVLNQTQLMASQRIFCLFDTLTPWLQDLDKYRRDLIFTFLFGSIDKCSMAYLAYGCKAYTRSLKYLEEYRHHSDGRLSPVCSTLFQQIYLALDDPDGAIGARGQRSVRDLRQKILAHEANNTNQDALACCSKALATYPEELEYYKKMIRCLTSLEQLSVAFLASEGTTKQKPQWKDKITPYMSSLAWQLGKWDALDKLISDSSHVAVEKSSMSLNISRLVNCAVTGNSEDYPNLLKSITLKAMRPIAVAVSEKLPYEMCYPHLVRIQELNEIRMACTILHSFCPDVDFENHTPSWLRKFWQTRNAYLQPNLKVLGVMLTLQRALYSLNSSNSKDYTMDIANCWLETAKLARKLGHKQRAYGCFLNLDEMIPQISHDLQFVASYIIERAKYEWSSGDDVSREAAIRVLEDGVKEHFSDFVRATQEKIGATRRESRAIKELPFEHRKAYFKIILLKTKFYEESGLQSTRNIIAMYSKLMDEVSRSEKGAIQLAKLYDDLCIYDKEAGSKVNCDYMRQAIIHYCTTLKLGCKYIYEALPRLLQIWFDLGSVVSHYEKLKSKRGRSRDFLRDLKDIQENFEKATQEVESMKSSVATSILYTALSQMLTRIDHSNKRVQQVLALLVIRILRRFPKQASWHLFANLHNKTSAALASACRGIINRATRESEERNFARFFHLMDDMAAHFISLIDEKTEKQKVMKLNQLQKVGLEKFLHSNPNLILMPCHKYLTASIMPKVIESSPHAFPHTVTILSIMNDIVVFDSLAKPKKFILRGSDGKLYPFLAKPQDDLRRDSRTVEYLELFNRLMLKDPETRKRNLKIVVFAVIPFGEESGLIEFIEGLTDIRSILMKGYFEHKNHKDLSMQSSWLKQLKEKHPGKNGASDETATRNFKEYVKDHCTPPVFWKWFNQTYTHPSEWHAAKLLFTRSLAVMSIVGYIIGLGDRHLENILIEKATGRIVHVDYNCIFNRGETLATPERVPFRLTHNLIDAMGSICFEGHFKRTCEEVLRLARSNAAPIMSVLKAFAFDPLVGAGLKTIKTQQQHARDSRGGAGDFSSKMLEDSPCTDKVSVADIVEKIEFCNKEASQSIKLIDERLRGLHRSSLSSDTDSHTRPLSVKGQVNALIEEATDEARLARMYFGWAPYL